MNRQSERRALHADLQGPDAVGGVASFFRDLPCLVSGSAGVEDEEDGETEEQVSKTREDERWPFLRRVGLEPS